MFGQQELEEEKIKAKLQLLGRYLFHRQFQIVDKSSGIFIDFDDQMLKFSMPRLMIDENLYKDTSSQMDLQSNKVSLNSRMSQPDSIDGSKDTPNNRDNGQKRHACFLQEEHIALIDRSILSAIPDSQAFTGLIQHPNYKHFIDIAIQKEDPSKVVEPEQTVQYQRKSAVITEKSQNSPVPNIESQPKEVILAKVNEQTEESKNVVEALISSIPPQKSFQILETYDTSRLTNQKPITQSEIQPETIQAQQLSGSDVPKTTPSQGQIIKASDDANKTGQDLRTLPKRYTTSKMTATNTTNYQSRYNQEQPRDYLRKRSIHQTVAKINDSNNLSNSDLGSSGIVSKRRPNKKTSLITDESKSDQTSLLTEKQAKKQTAQIRQGNLNVERIENESVNQIAEFSSLPSEVESEKERKPIEKLATVEDDLKSADLAEQNTVDLSITTAITQADPKDGTQKDLFEPQPQDCSPDKNKSPINQELSVSQIAVDAEQNDQQTLQRSLEQQYLDLSSKSQSNSISLLELLKSCQLNKLKLKFKPSRDEVFSTITISIDNLEEVIGEKSTQSESVVIQYRDT